MAKITINDLRELFDVVADVKDVRLTFCLDAATRTLRSWIGSKYDDLSLFDAVKFAEANLAVYHLLLNTGLRIRRDGLVKQEQDAGGSVTNNVINVYYTPEELMELREGYYKAALDEMETHRTAATGTNKMGSMPIRPWWAKDDAEIEPDVSDLD